MLAPKVIRTPRRPYVEVGGRMRGEGAEEPIRARVRLEGDQFVMDLDTGEQGTAEVQDTQKRVAEAVAANLNVGSERG